MRARPLAVALAVALVPALVAGCKSQPGAVNLTIVADPSLPDATVAAIRILEIGVSGAASTSQSYLVDQPFSSGRQERLSIRTSVSSGTLDLSVLARAAAGDALAYGQTSVALESGGPVAAQIVLTGDLPAFDMGAGAGVDGSGDGGTVVGPTIQLVAGQLGGIGNADGVGAAARFNNPRALAYDGGNLYVTDQQNHCIRKIDVTTGAVSTIAGSALQKGTADGVGAAARFNHPFGLAADGAGNLYVADMNNDTIRKIVLASGTVTTIAGTAGTAGSGDGSGAGATFDHPHGLVYDGAGALYVADARSLIIRKLVLSGAVVTTIAGTAGMRGSANGTGAAALFSSPHALAFHNGNLYVADTRNQTVRQLVVSSAAVTTLAGSAGAGGWVDATGGNARFAKPRGITADGAGKLYVADSDNDRIRVIDEATGQVTTLAGQGYGSSDGVGAGANFAGPMAVATDGAGNLYVADGWGSTIRKVVVATATVTTLAGAAGGDGLVDGRGAAALFTRPHGIAVDGKTLYVADKQSNVVRKVDLATNDVTTLAGSGQQGAADGVGPAAQLNSPFAVASDGAGTLFVADNGNDTIRKIDVASGTVSTLAGAAGQAGSLDDTGAKARFSSPAGMVYTGGTLYVADLNNDTIRKIDVASAAVTTLAGTAGQTGTTDDTGAKARFNNPNGLALDGGNLYVVDESNHTIRQIVLATAAVTTLAGGAGMVGSADGTGGAARFDMPHAIAADGAGNLYVADTRNHTVRKLVIATGAVSTWAGVAGVGAVQLGALPGGLNTPTGLAIGSDGAVYLASAHENAILVIK